ncbi:protein far1-related sequence 5-like [Gigaspora margarita]|uniref:Protein far1-related sequence 5-like n=1 Tax=Gigaspora margarita TaxID=4874 RepID=A0A8H4EIL4_GIGMA|nr:protein far1-related sequence 5-like [Gigaspora margarita]
MERILFKSIENILPVGCSDGGVNTYKSVVYKSFPNESTAKLNTKNNTDTEPEYGPGNNSEYNSENISNDNSDSNSEDSSDENSEDNSNTSGHKLVDNSHDLCQHTWDCEQSGKYILRKTAPPEKQRNKGSKRINCPFLINVSKSKGPDYEIVIKLTSVHLEHNHPLLPENATFATGYQKLTREMKDLIKSYTLCDLDVSS